MNAHEHGTGSVEGLAQSGSDLVWAIDSEARSAECIGVLDRVDGPKIDAGKAVVLDEFLRTHHVVGAIDPNHVDQVGLETHGCLEFIGGEEKAAIARD